MIYADYNGSAPLSDDVKNYLIQRFEKGGPYANPNSIHYLGSKCLMAMEKARKTCAKILDADPHQLIFNSGSSEGISTVFHSLLDTCSKPKKDLIITSGIEHSAIVKTAQFYESKGYKNEVVKALPNGVVNLEELFALMDKNENRIAMVSIMAANNETGVIQPYKEIGEKCAKLDIPFFCDTTQLIGKTGFSFRNSNSDFAVMSGHKIGAMTGTGVLLAKDPTRLKALIHGGGQENNLRGGTQHYIGNETLAIALESFDKNKSKIEALKNKRIEFEQKLKEKFPKLVILGEDGPRLASTSYISYPGIHGQAIQIELESNNIFVTTSSACSDNEPATSKVLKAMGVTDDIGRGVVRISLGLCSPLEYYDKIYDSLCKAYEKVCKIKNF